MSYDCQVLADSISARGHRLTTVQVRFPRFILAEVNTHRMLSRNSASSRAIPTERIIEQVEKDPFVPQTFNKRVKGMGVGDALSPDQQERAEDLWRMACTEAIETSRCLMEIDSEGLDKSRVNRLLEPFMWHTAIISATEWDNFFALRDHPAAQPEFRILAQLMLIKMRTSEPFRIKENEERWHLPLVTPAEIHEHEPTEPNWKYWAMVSAGRCARVSFDRAGQYEDPEDSYKRAEMLLKNGHLSPLEHPAVPLASLEWSGNFWGWMQLRKMTPHESNLVGHLEHRARWDEPGGDHH